MGQSTTSKVAIEIFDSHLQSLISSYIFESEESLRARVCNLMTFTPWIDKDVFELNNLLFLQCKKTKQWQIGYREKNSIIGLTHEFLPTGFPVMAQHVDLLGVFEFLFAHLTIRKPDSGSSKKICRQFCNRLAIYKVGNWFIVKNKS